MHRENALYPNAEAYPAHGEGGRSQAPAARDNHALERLDALLLLVAIRLAQLDVHANGVPGLELRNAGAQLSCLYFIYGQVHNGIPWQTLMGRAGTSKANTKV